MTYHVYLKIDAHVEVEAESPEEADRLATEQMELAIALDVDSPPKVVVSDVCDSDYQSLEY